MRSTLRRFAVIAMGAVAALSLSFGSATADPYLLDDGTLDPHGFLPDSNDLVGTGAETTQYLTDFLARGWNGEGHDRRLASYDAVSPVPGTPFRDQIILRDPNQDTPISLHPVPNNDDIVAFRGDGGIGMLETNTNVDFARSSRPSNGSSAERALSFIPFAQDGLSYVVDDTTSVPTNLTAGDLHNIYTCQLPGFDAKLPQAGSGTRAFFLAQINVTEAQIADAVAAGCVDDTVQENDPSAVDGDPLAIAPFSTARYVSNPPDPNNPPSNTVTLASNVDPDAFFVTRDLYNVVRDSDVNNTDFQAVFGPEGFICQQFADATDNTIEGFVGVGSRCGHLNPDV